MVLDLNIPQVIKDILVEEERQNCLKLSDELRKQIYTYLDNQNEMNDKLLKYNQLEEELGCDLIEAGKVLYIIITKELDTEDFRMCIEKNENDYEAFEEFNSKQWTSSEITLVEYFLIKNVYYKIIEKFYKLNKDKEN